MWLFLRWLGWSNMSTHRLSISSTKWTPPSSYRNEAYSRHDMTKIAHFAVNTYYIHPPECGRLWLWRFYWWSTIKYHNRDTFVKVDRFFFCNTIALCYYCHYSLWRKLHCLSSDLIKDTRYRKTRLIKEAYCGSRISIR